MLDALKTAARVGARRGKARAPTLNGDTPVHRAANAATIIAVVVIGVVALVGILIYSQIEEAIPQAALENDDGTRNELGNSADALTEGFGGAMELVPVVLLVLVAALVIGVVQRMRQ